MGNAMESSSKQGDDGELSDEDSHLLMEEKKEHGTSYRSLWPTSSRDFHESINKTSVHTTSFTREEQQHKTSCRSPPPASSRDFHQSYLHKRAVHLTSSPKENVYEESHNLNANLLFYQNKLQTRPGTGYYIEEILKWYGDYELLEKNPDCIQWLFPTSSGSSRNPKAQPLQDHEAVAIRKDDILTNRAIRAFVLMLDFYGMRPVIHRDGSMEVEKSSNWRERYQNLNNSWHSPRRITRILSSMRALGFEQYQYVWLRFLLVEALQNKTLEYLDGENIQYWIDTVENDSHKGEVLEFYRHLKMQNDGGRTTLTLNSSSNLGHVLEDDFDHEECDMETDNSSPMDCIVNVAAKSCVFMEEECENSQHWLINMPNVSFYLNKTKSKPEPGFYLEELKHEPPEFGLMKKMHKHIQWLFPNPNQSEVNPDSKPLTEIEALVFQNVKEVRDRFVEVYRLMLACYGLHLVSMDTGEIQKIHGCEERFYDLNKLTALPKIITRILTSLAVLGFTQCQVPLVYFLLREAMVEKSLPNLDGNNVQYWIGVIENNEDRQIIADAWKSLKESQQRSVPAEWNLPEIVRTEGLRQVDTDKVANDIGNYSWSLPEMGRADGVRQNTTGKVANNVGKTEWSLPHLDRREDVRENGANHGSDNTGKSSSTENRMKSPVGRIKKFVGNFLCGTEVKRSHDSMEDRPYIRENLVTQQLCANVEFYSNQKKSSLFWGHKIEDMLQWKGDYYKLEMNHQYIQWLFPIPEGSGVNPSAQALQSHEAETIKNCTVLRRRVLRSYEMMLDFYGMKLIAEGSTEVQRSHNWRERYLHLNRSGHNHLRITRIIKSIGHLGLQKYQLPWVKFILHEIFEASVLPRLGGRQLEFWIGAIADESEKQEAYAAYVTLKEKHL